LRLSFLLVANLLHIYTSKFESNSVAHILNKNSSSQQLGSQVSDSILMTEIDGLSFQVLRTTPRHCCFLQLVRDGYMMWQKNTWKMSMNRLT